MIMIHVAALLFMIFVNALMVLIEIAVVSARPSLLRQMEQEGKWGAARAVATLDNPNVFLSTAQIGITLAGILSGAYGGATLEKPLAEFLKNLPYFSDYAEVIALPAIVITVTYLSLVAGELVPKRLALQFAEKISCIFTPPMYALSVAFRPFVWFLDFSGDLLLKPFGWHKTTKRPVTPEELQQMAKQGHQEGGIERDEMNMVRRVFHLSDRTLASVMTPRIMVEWLRLDMTQDEIRGIVMLSEFTQFPVAQDSLERPIGCVDARNLLCQLTAGGKLNIQTMLRPPLFLPESINAMDALRKMQAAKESMALVIDQYGVCCGIATLEDITSVLVFESEPVEISDASVKTQTSWITEGLMDIHVLSEMLSFKSLPSDIPDAYHTLGGMAMAMLGKVPQIGDVFEWEGYRFEILSMLGQRVSNIKISKINTSEPVNTPK